jgi:hypothetical protein
LLEFHDISRDDPWSVEQGLRAQGTPNWLSLTIFTKQCHNLGPPTFGQSQRCQPGNAAEEANQGHAMRILGQTLSEAMLRSWKEAMNKILALWAKLENPVPAIFEVAGQVP